MIQPSKHTDPDKTIIRASTLIIQTLKKKRIIALKEIKRILSEHRINSTYLLNPSLEMLYLLGTIKYHPKTDSIEITNDEAF